MSVISSKRIQLLIPLVLGTIATQSSMASIAPLFAEIRDEFGVSTGVVGQLRTISAGFAVLGTFITGSLIDRIGVRPVLIGGALVAAAGSAASAAAPSFLVLLVAQGLTGLGIASLLSGGFAGAGAFFDRADRDWAIGWIVALQSVAWIVGIPVVGALADAYSWRISLLVVPVGFSVLALAAAVLLSPRQEHKPNEQGPTGLMAALRQRESRRWALAELLAFATWTAEITYIATFYIDTYGLSETLVGLLLPTGSITFLIGSALTYRLTRRVRRRTLLTAAALAMGLVSTALFNYSPAVVVTMLMGSAMGVFSGVRAAASSTLALDILPGQSGAMMAARTAAAQLGYLVGAAVGGLAISMTGGYGALGLIMVVGMGASAIAMATLPDPKPLPHKDSRKLPSIID